MKITQLVDAVRDLKTGWIEIGQFGEVLRKNPIDRASAREVLELLLVAAEKDNQHLIFLVMEFSKKIKLTSDLTLVKLAPVLAKMTEDYDCKKGTWEILGYFLQNRSKKMPSAAELRAVFTPAIFKKLAASYSANNDEHSQVADSMAEFFKGLGIVTADYNIEEWLKDCVRTAQDSDEIRKVSDRIEFLTKCGVTISQTLVLELLDIAKDKTVGCDGMLDFFTPMIGDFEQLSKEQVRKLFQDFFRKYDSSSPSDQAERVRFFSRMPRLLLKEVMIDDMAENDKYRIGGNKIKHNHQVIKEELGATLTEDEVMSLLPRIILHRDSEEMEVFFREFFPLVKSPQNKERILREFSPSQLLKLYVELNNSDLRSDTRDMDLSLIKGKLRLADLLKDAYKDFRLVKDIAFLEEQNLSLSQSQFDDLFEVFNDRMDELSLAKGYLLLTARNINMSLSQSQVDDIFAVLKDRFHTGSELVTLLRFGLAPNNSLSKKQFDQLVETFLEGDLLVVKYPENNLLQILEVGIGHQILDRKKMGEVIEKVLKSKCDFKYLKGVIDFALKYGRALLTGLDHNLAMKYVGEMLQGSGNQSYSKALTFIKSSFVEGIAVDSEIADDLVKKIVGKCKGKDEGKDALLLLEYVLRLSHPMNHNLAIKYVGEMLESGELYTANAIGFIQMYYVEGIPIDPQIVHKSAEIIARRGSIDLLKYVLNFLGPLDHNLALKYACPIVKGGNIDMMAQGVIDFIKSSFEEGTHVDYALVADLVLTVDQSKNYSKGQDSLSYGQSMRDNQFFREQLKVLDFLQEFFPSSADTQKAIKVALRKWIRDESKKDGLLGKSRDFLILRQMNLKFTPQEISEISLDTLQHVPEIFGVIVNLLLSRENEDIPLPIPMLNLLREVIEFGPDATKELLYIARIKRVANSDTNAEEIIKLLKDLEGDNVDIIQHVFDFLRYQEGHDFMNSSQFLSQLNDSTLFILGVDLELITRLHPTEVLNILDSARNHDDEVLLSRACNFLEHRLVFLGEDAKLEKAKVLSILHKLQESHDHRSIKLSLLLSIMQLDEYLTLEEAVNLMANVRNISAAHLFVFLQRNYFASNPELRTHFLSQLSVPVILGMMINGADLSESDLEAVSAKLVEHVASSGVGSLIENFPEYIVGKQIFQVLHSLRHKIKSDPNDGLLQKSWPILTSGIRDLQYLKMAIEFLIESCRKDGAVALKSPIEIKVPQEITGQQGVLQLTQVDQAFALCKLWPEFLDDSILIELAKNPTVFDRFSVTEFLRFLVKVGNKGGKNLSDTDFTALSSKIIEHAEQFGVGVLMINFEDLSSRDQLMVLHRLRRSIKTDFHDSIFGELWSGIRENLCAADKKKAMEFLIESYDNGSAVSVKLNPTIDISINHVNGTRETVQLKKINDVVVLCKHLPDLIDDSILIKIAQNDNVVAAINKGLEFYNAGFVSIEQKNLLDRFNLQISQSRGNLLIKTNSLLSFEELAQNISRFTRTNAPIIAEVEGDYVYQAIKQDCSFEQFYSKLSEKDKEELGLTSETESLIRGSWRKFQQNMPRVREFASLCHKPEELRNSIAAQFALIVQGNCSANLAILLQRAIESRVYANPCESIFATALCVAGLPVLNSSADVLQSHTSYENIITGDKNVFLPQQYFCHLVGEEILAIQSAIDEARDSKNAEALAIAEKRMPPGQVNNLAVLARISEIIAEAAVVDEDDDKERGEFMKKYSSQITLFIKEIRKDLASESSESKKVFEAFTARKLEEREEMIVKMGRDLCKSIDAEKFRDEKPTTQTLTRTSRRMVDQPAVASHSGSARVQ